MANGKNTQIDGKAPFVDSCSGLHQEVWPVCFGANMVVPTTVKQLQRSRSRVVARLLVVKPERRLGANGIEEVSTHGCRIL